MSLQIHHINQDEYSNLQNNRKEMRDVPVVAGRADGGVPQQPAVLCERRGKARAVHGAEGPGQDARHDLPKVEFVGETVMAKTSKPKNSTF